MKKVLAILMLMVSLVLTGCVKEEQVHPDSLESIQNNGPYGFYVKKSDTLFPIIPMEDNENLRWYAGDPNCPKVTSKSPLIMVYDTKDDMPEEIILEKYESLGYTIGGQIKEDEDQETMLLSTDIICENSDFANQVSSGNLDTEVEVVAISDKNGRHIASKLIDNVDTEANVLTGLAKNKSYTFEIYSGTNHYTSDVKADTFALKMIDKIDITDNPIKKTNKGYFIVNLPENLEPGYYGINEAGIFEYVG